ncbi:hypothetical protein BGZ76_009538 [Entomortierella beljakovae]|nr:hypothetical protein BGZ76_009538 [Entomortierella beljakovae]
MTGVQQHSVLFILDGFDEISYEAQTDLNMKSFLDNLLSQRHVIMTSRPSDVDTSIILDLPDHPLRHIDLELEAVGYSKKSINDYIKKVLSEEKAKAFIEFVQQTPAIQRLVNIPGQLDGMCYSWDSPTENSDNSDPVTFTNLYQGMIYRLWRKDALRLRKKHEHGQFTVNSLARLRIYQLATLMANEINFLCKLAFKGIKNNQIEFNQDSLEKVKKKLDQLPEQSNKELQLDFLEAIKQTSFLHTTTTDNKQQSWHFTDLMCQDYFAASWMACILSGGRYQHRLFPPTSSEQDKIRLFIQQNKYNPRYEMVWWMLAGQLEGESLKTFFEMLLSEPIDMIGVRHALLLSGCYKESLGKMGDQQATKVENEISEILNFDILIRPQPFNGSILGGHLMIPDKFLISERWKTEIEMDYILKALEVRSYITPSAIQYLIDLYNNPGSNDGLRFRIIAALETQSTLHEDAIKFLVEVLMDKVLKFRLSAATALRRQIVLTESVIQCLSDTLFDQDKDIRSAAVIALGRQSILSETTIQCLIDVSNSSVGYIQALAIRALGKQPELPPLAIEIIMKNLTIEDGLVRESAAEALGCQSTLPQLTIQYLINTLKDEEWMVSSAALDALQNLSMLPPQAIQSFVMALMDEDEFVRTSAAKVLEKQSISSESDIQPLVNALKDVDRDVRSSAVRALGRLPALPNSVANTLVATLDDGDEDEDVRSSAALALGQQLGHNRLAMLSLINALKDKDEFIRTSAATSLEQSPFRQEYEHLLIAMLVNKGCTGRTYAASLLGSLSTLSTPATQSLIEALKDEDEEVRSSAADSLKKQHTLPDLAIQPLIDALKDKSDTVRSIVVSIFERQPKLSEPAIEALVDAFKDKDWIDKASVAHALGRQRDLPVSATDALADALKFVDKIITSSGTDKHNEHVRAAAADALGNQLTLSQTTIQCLIDSLMDEVGQVRSSAVKALGRQSQLKEVAIEALIGALQDKDSSVWSSATRALEIIRELPRPSIKILASNLEDNNEDIRTSAARVLATQKRLPASTVMKLLNILGGERVDTEVILRVIPDMSAEEIKHVFQTYIFPNSRRRYAVLYVHDDCLCFYTDRGSFDLPLGIDGLRGVLVVCDVNPQASARTSSHPEKVP